MPVFQNMYLTEAVNMLNFYIFFRREKHKNINFTILKASINKIKQTLCLCKAIKYIDITGF